MNSIMNSRNSSNGVGEGSVSSGATVGGVVEVGTLVGIRVGVSVEVTVGRGVTVDCSRGLCVIRGLIQAALSSIVAPRELTSRTMEPVLPASGARGISNPAT